MLQSEAKRERMLKSKSLKSFDANLDPLKQQSVSSYPQRSRETMGRGQCPNFAEEKFTLAARNGFVAEEKISFRWHDLCRLIEPNKTMWTQ